METETPSVHRERIRLDWQEGSIRLPKRNRIIATRLRGPAQRLFSLARDTLYPSNHYSNVGIGYEVGGQVEGQNTEMPHRPLPKECSPAWGHDRLFQSGSPFTQYSPQKLPLGISSAPPSHHNSPLNQQTSIFRKTTLNPSQPRNWMLKTPLP